MSVHIDDICQSQSLEELVIGVAMYKCSLSQLLWPLLILHQVLRLFEDERIAVSHSHREVLRDFVNQMNASFLHAVLTSSSVIDAALVASSLRSALVRTERLPVDSNTVGVKAASFLSATGTHFASVCFSLITIAPPTFCAART